MLQQACQGKKSFYRLAHISDLHFGIAQQCYRRQKGNQSRHRQQFNQRKPGFF